MAYDGGYPQQGRPYTGPAAQRPINRHYPPKQYNNSNAQYDDYQDGVYYDGASYEGAYYDGGYHDEPAGFSQDYGGGGGGGGGGRYPPPPRGRPSQDDYHNGPPPGRGNGGMPPPSGRGGMGGHYGPPPGGRGFPSSGGLLPASPAPNRGGRPGPGQFQMGPLSDPPAQPRPPINNPPNAGTGGFGGSAFPVFPGREKQSDRDEEAKILTQMAGMEVGDTARPTPGRGYGGPPPPGPPNRGGYGPRGPPRGPPQPYPSQRDMPSGPGPGPRTGPRLNQYEPRRNDWDQGCMDNSYRPPPPRDEFGPPMRSVTMPVGDLNRGGGFMPPPRSDSMGFNSPPAHAPRRPSSSEGRRPIPQRQFPPDQRPPNGHGAQNARNGHDPQQSYGNPSDAYYHCSGPPNDGSMGDPDYGVPASGNPGGHSDYGRPRGSLDEYSRPRESLDGPQGHPPPSCRPELNRTKSQPALRRSQDAVFGTAADAPPMPLLPLPPAAVPVGPTLYQPYRPGNVSAPPLAPETSHPSSPPQPFVEPLQMHLPNPDGLPSHPVPFRPSLANPISPDDRPAPVRNYNLAGGVVDSPGGHQKPMPVRNYNGIPASNATPPAQAPAQQHKPKEPPVTPEELERLRLRSKAEPNDKETALTLAKKLLEACDVLVPATQDPKSRGRMRERFALDAQKVLKKLCHQQVAEALFLMADSLGRGAFGGEPDNKDAFTHYQSAAKLGHAAAAYRTAVCCEIGNEEGGGTRKDPLKAIQWYKRAATLGDTPAMYKVGMILLKGLLGQQRNPREAVGWLKRAAERADSDNPHALHELGLLYESASPNDAIVRDPGYALELFHQAAELGYKFSQFRLGCIYEYGLMSVLIDPRMSIMWYSKAAMQEEHQAELALSGWYLTGSEGVLAQSDTEAYLWARKAAMAGLPKAEYAMGYFTEVGIGVAPHLEDAKRWYWRAAAQDFPKARERLEDLKRSNKTGPRPRERIARNSKQQEGECTVM